MRWLLLTFLLLSPCLAAAGPLPVDDASFGRIAVLHDGRVKPLDSLARVMLPRVCGCNSYEGRSASQWLAFLFFAPAEAMKTPMITVHSPRVAQMLGLPPRADSLYRFEELAAILPAHRAFFSSLLEKDKSLYSADETEALRVYGAFNDFAELTGTFSLLLPMSGVDETLRPRLHLAPGEPVTYMAALKVRPALEDALKEVVKRKGAKIDSYTADERALARLAARLDLQEQLDGDNALVRLIPPAWGGEEWLSPWGVLKASVGSPMSAGLLRDWRGLAESYRSGDRQSWNATTRRLQAESVSAMTPLAAFRVTLEWYYHRLNLLLLAACSYGLGLLLVGAGGRMLRPGHAVMALGLLLHAQALLMRMVILLRPPVSTLYESLIFVSFVVMAASLWLGLRGANRQALLTGGLTGFALLLTSNIFAGEGDTLGVLTAVLNTNFWLATHVVCITTGYGSALVAGAMAHLILFRRAVLRAPEAELAPLGLLLHSTALIALLFTAVGTMLGGIWADQSWGRFWGWDPKENGALLIVLWLIWALHGRIAGQLSAVAFTAVMALMNVVVALAWIGVNLLGVGLHSYGFTDAAAQGLVAFCAAEGAYVALMLIALKWRPQVMLPSR